MRRWLSLLAAAALLLAGCGTNSGERTRVSLRQVAPLPTAGAQEEQRPPVLRLAVASMVSPGGAIEDYTQLAQYLEGPFGGRVELLQRRTYAETYELLRTGCADSAAVCTYVYVLGHKEFGLQLVAAPEVGGETTYRSLIIVRADSGIKEFTGLKGKRFAFTDPLSTTGRLYPLLLLRERQETPESYFASSSYTYSHDNSILAVLDGVADGASVDSLVYHQWTAAHPDKAGDLKVLQTSPPYGSPPFVVAPSAPPTLRATLRAALLSMEEDKDGERVLKLLGVDLFREPADAEYDDVRRLAESVGMTP